MGDYKVTIHGIDFMGLLNILDSINKRYIKITLDNIESVLNSNISDEERYKLIRKYILDGFNEFSRNILRSLFDYEDNK